MEREREKEREETEKEWQLWNKNFPIVIKSDKAYCILGPSPSKDMNLWSMSVFEHQLILQDLIVRSRIDTL